MSRDIISIFNYLKNNKMKKFLLLLSLATLIARAESNPYIDEIKIKVKEDALGVEMNYESIFFQWKDSLIIGKQAGEIAFWKKDFQSFFFFNLIVL